MSQLSAMAASVGERLKASRASLGVSESSCGGLISAALVAVPGASAYYLGGGVIYTAASREGLLAIGPDAMKGLRASTEPYALLNAPHHPGIPRRHLGSRRNRCQRSHRQPLR